MSEPTADEIGAEIVMTRSRKTARAGGCEYADHTDVLEQAANAIEDLLALVAAQAEEIAVVRALCDRGDFERDAFAASVGSGGAPTGEAWIRVRDVRAALDGTEGDA